MDLKAGACVVNASTMQLILKLMCILFIPQNGCDQWWKIIDDRHSSINSINSYFKCLRCCSCHSAKNTQTWSFWKQKHTRIADRNARPSKSSCCGMQQVAPSGAFSSVLATLVQKITTPARAGCCTCAIGNNARLLIENECPVLEAFNMMINAWRPSIVCRQLHVL